VHVEFHSLDEMFPGSGLGAAFDGDATFRAALHQVRVTAQLTTHWNLLKALLNLQGALMKPNWNSYYSQAARDDLFTPSPNFSAQQNARIKGPGSTLCVVRAVWGLIVDREIAN
jgi:hypothetical protein